jgi:hypothetical protein
MSSAPEKDGVGTKNSGVPDRATTQGIAEVSFSPGGAGIEPARQVQEKNEGQPDLLPPK